MADPVEVAKREARERAEMIGKLNHLQASIDKLQGAIDQLLAQDGAVKAAPKRSTRAKKESDA